MSIWAPGCSHLDSLKGNLFYTTHLLVLLDEEGENEIGSLNIPGTTAWIIQELAQSVSK